MGAYQQLDRIAAKRNAGGAELLISARSSMEPGIKLGFTVARRYHNAGSNWLCWQILATVNKEPEPSPRDRVFGGAWAKIRAELTLALSTAALAGASKHIVQAMASSSVATGLDF